MVRPALRTGNGIVEPYYLTTRGPSRECRKVREVGLLRHHHHDGLAQNLEEVAVAAMAGTAACAPLAP